MKGSPTEALPHCAINQDSNLSLSVSEPEGFEPPSAGIKTRWLATCLQLNNNAGVNRLHSLPVTAAYIFPHRVEKYIFCRPTHRHRGFITATHKRSLLSTRDPSDVLFIHLGRGVEFRIFPTAPKPEARRWVYVVIIIKTATSPPPPLDEKTKSVPVAPGFTHGLSRKYYTPRDRFRHCSTRQI